MVPVMLALTLTLLVAAAHVGFMVLETFLWTTPRVRRIFGQSREQAEVSKVLAANQGVYNGAIGASLAWAALARESAAASALLAIVVVVGVYGAATAKRSILFVQAMPAAFALVAVRLVL
jgi:putative membrane protein